MFGTPKKSPLWAGTFCQYPGWLLLFGGGACFAVLAAEALDAAGGIDQLLLAGKERVATRADFYADVALVCRARGKGAATGAVHAHFMIRGMDCCLHGVSKWVS
jgi:hypothetical protein